MNLIVDQGNTATKLALFDAEKKMHSNVSFAKNEVEKVEKWISDHVELIESVIVSSVTNDILAIPVSRRIDLDFNTPLPLVNRYETPQTLGKDRIANAVGAWRKNPNRASLVIDLGTCIKYDLVSSNGEYLGGNISPGMEMRYKALNHFTDQLPRIEAEVFEFNFGTDTKTSIQNGVQQAITHEINGFIQRYSLEFAQLTIFMTGGDLKYFDKGFKNSIFANPIIFGANLTLFGLNEILSYNVEI